MTIFIPQVQYDHHLSDKVAIWIARKYESVIRPFLCNDVQALHINYFEVFTYIFFAAMSDYKLQEILVEHLQ